MKIIYNNLIPFKGFAAINVLGFVFARKEYKPLNPTIVNHEAIHTAQMKELAYVFFYLVYLFEWSVRLLMKGNAYRNISFEREAYANQGNPEYLKERRCWEMWR